MTLPFSFSPDRDKYQLPTKPMMDIKNIFPGFMSKVLTMPALGNTLGGGCVRLTPKV
jgi:hypothetical protein